ncbi:MAG TPA: amidohydrolase family protein [Gemmatirosa sp.]
MRLYTARWLFPVSTPPVRDGAVAVDDAGRIAYAGPAAGAPTGDVHALGDAVLLPGLVAASIAPAPPYAALRAAGVTTVAAILADDADLDALIASGLRAVAYLRVTGPTPADRAPALAAVRTAIDRARAALAAATAMPRVRPGVAPGPIDVIDEDLLLDACAWAVGENLPLAIAASATAAELSYVRDAAGPHADRHRAAGRTVVRRAHSTVHLLAELGVAAVARPLLTGAALFDDSDVALAAYYDCPVAYDAPHRPPTPSPLLALLDAGTRVCLAARTDLLTAARALTRTPAEAVRLLTLGAAHALELGAEVGSLEVGKRADLCAFPLTPPEPGAEEVASAEGPLDTLFAAAPRPALLTTIAAPTLREA